MKRRVTSHKKAHSTSRTTHGSKHNFMAAVHHTIPFVFQFAETLIATMTDSRVVSQDFRFHGLVDVYHQAFHLGLEVKACNGRHAARPRKEVIEKLAAETTFSPEAEVDLAMYAIMFYRGFHPSGDQAGKSRFLSRRLSRSDKSRIMAEEIQTIYFVDIDLMEHLSSNTVFRNAHRSLNHVKVHDGRKPTYAEREVLYLNRTFLARFFPVKPQKIPEDCRLALQSVYGKNGWSALEIDQAVRFSGKGQTNPIKKNLKVRFLGRKSIVRRVSRLVEKKVRTMVI